MFHPYFQLSVLTHTLITNNFFLSWQVILKPGCNYVFPIYFQLCERSRTLLSNLASATGDFGVPVYPPGRCPLLTLGPETAVETFHLKGFGGFGLFITSLSQSLVFHSVRMRGIGNFCFPCAVLLCCSTCTTEATSVATL